MVVSSSQLHIIGVPLLIMAGVTVGFVTVALKEVLLPFVISIFLVYLLRPLVNLLTTPFGQWFILGGCIAPALSAGGASSST